MTQTVVEVGYQYVYDLYYRVRQARLESEIYRLDFWDWVKAGIAYNTRGISEPSRKIANFVRYYNIIQNDLLSDNIVEMRTAISHYYEDFFQLYQDHLVAQLKIAHKRGSNASTEPSNLILLPSFEQTSQLQSIFPMEEIVLETYECQHLEELRRHMSTVYAVEGSPLFRCMALYFDYGVQGNLGGTLLGVR